MTITNTKTNTETQESISKLALNKNITKRKINKKKLKKIFLIFFFLSNFGFCLPTSGYNIPTQTNFERYEITGFGICHRKDPKAKFNFPLLSITCGQVSLFGTLTTGYKLKKYGRGLLQPSMTSIDVSNL